MKTAEQIASHVRSGRVTASENATEALERAHADRLNALTVVRDVAVTEAAEVPLSGRLAGVPMVIKEEVAVAGEVTTFGGVANTRPEPRDAEIVRRLRAEGAVIIAKSAMPEFGTYPYTESAATGYTLNPWNPAHSPGGSSGGTAAAVASGIVPVGIGGDGGGSIRIPAAMCGLYGLKPTRGRTSADPASHLWWALGTSGPISRTVADSALVYDVIAGTIEADRFRAGPIGSLAEAAEREPGRLRIGWSTKPVSVGVRPDPVHVDAVSRAARLLTDLGHDVREVEPRYPDPTLAFVPQFLGGLRAEADAVEHPERLERRIRQLLKMGAWVTPGILERAITASENLGRTCERVFDGIDLLLTPTIAHRPPRIGILDQRGPVRASLAAMPAIAYTALWNVAGNPAASIPIGIASDGLPTAVQLVGRHDTEELLISLSAQIEAAAPWPFPDDPSH